MKELFEFLSKLKISPNGLLALYSLQSDFKVTNYINYQTELFRLQSSGHVEMKNNKYCLTPLGELVLRKADTNIRMVKTKANLKIDQWKNEITKFNEIFPKGKKPNSLIGFRSNPKEIFPRFIWFFNEYPEYSWEDVFNATEKYVQKFKDEHDFTYMQVSKYFIKKDDVNKISVSTLANVCQSIANGDEEADNNGFQYFESK